MKVIYLGCLHHKIRYKDRIAEEQMHGCEQYLNVLQPANNCQLKKTDNPPGVGNGAPVAVFLKYI